MAKEKSANPVAAHQKAEKQRALKKGKASLQAQRAERLARRNPERLQRQADELRATRDAQSGQLRPRDAAQLEQLERDVAAIRKARASQPEGSQVHNHERRRSPRREHDGERRGGHQSRGRGDAHGRDANQTTLGKRRRGFGSDEDGHSDSEQTDPEARDIPMPRDTPPPVPSRRSRRQPDGPREKQPAAPAQTTYSSAPQLRDLKQEATSAFVPSAVAARLRQKQQTATHGGKLLEPEELDRLEASGYRDARGAAEEAAKEEAHLMMAQGALEGDKDLDAEQAAFERELALADEQAEGQAAGQDGYIGAQREQNGGGSGTRPTGSRQVEIEEVEDAGD